MGQQDSWVTLTRTNGDEGVVYGINRFYELSFSKAKVCVWPTVIVRSSVWNTKYPGSGLKTESAALFSSCYIFKTVNSKLQMNVAGGSAVSSFRLTQQCSPTGSKAGCFILQSEEVHQPSFPPQPSEYLTIAPVRLHFSPRIKFS